MEAKAIRTIARDFAWCRTRGRVRPRGRVDAGVRRRRDLADHPRSNLACGRVDAEGGAMRPRRSAVDLIWHADQKTKPHSGCVFRSLGRAGALPEFAGELPVAALAEEIETAGKGQVRALVTHGGNPVLSTPNGGRLDRALARFPF